jgi:hypothetical protein
LDSGIDNVTREHRGYASDDKHVYFLDAYLGKTNIVKNADPKTFQSFENGFGKDDKMVYYGRFQLPKTQHESWRHIQGPFSRDGGHVYYENRLLSKADAATFEVLPGDGRWARDKKNYYSCLDVQDRDSYFEMFRNFYIFVGVVKHAHVVDGELKRVPGETWADANAEQSIRLHIQCTEWLFEPGERATNQPRVAELIEAYGGDGSAERCIGRNWIWFFQNDNGMIRPIRDSNVFEPLANRAKIEKLIHELATVA